MFSDLKGRTAIVFGVANKRSIAWSIAQGLHNAGARLIITYQNERLEQEARDLIASLPGAEGFMCDVSKDEEIDRLFAQVKERYGKLHVLVHSVAYAPAEELKGEFVNTTREGFRIAHDISVYSLIAVSRAAAPLMEDGGSIITMTYYGAEKVVPHYNVMAVAKAALECSVRYLAFDLGKKKIRVNAISAGPIKTLAARGISGLERNVEVPRRTRPTPTKCRCGRSGFNRSVLGVGRKLRHHRRSNLRRLWIQHDGILEGALLLACNPKRVDNGPAERDIQQHVSSQSDLPVFRRRAFLLDDQGMECPECLRPANSLVG